LKKAITLFIVLLLLAGLTGAALAADTGNNDNVPGQEQRIKLSLLKDLDGWETLLSERAEGKELRQAIKS